MAIEISLKAQDFRMQCRCCLSEQPPLYELFELNLDHILPSVANVMVERNDGLPAFACEGCIRKARASLHFKQQCERVDQAIRRLLAGLPQQHETERSEDDDAATLGCLRRDETELEETAESSENAPGNDESTEPFDHEYCVNFGQENVEMLEECYELVEQYRKGCSETASVLDSVEALRQFNNVDDNECTERCSATEDSNEDIHSTGSTSISHEMAMEEELSIEEQRVLELAPSHNDSDTCLHVNEAEKNTPADQCTGVRQHTRSRWKASPSLQDEDCGRRCEGCGRRFSRPSFMKRHAASFTGIVLLQEPRVENKGPLCTLCGRAFRYQSMLRRHTRLCKGRAKFDFVSDVVDHYTDEEFRNHFRMSRSTADMLVQSFERSNFFRVRAAGGRQEITARAQILSFLWFCGKNTSFYKVCRVFRFAMATFHKHMNLILDFLHQIAQNIIKLPATDEEKEQLSVQYAKMIPVRNVLGCIDSCMINCVRHTESKHADEKPGDMLLSIPSTRKHNGSIALQAIADASGKFMYVNTNLLPAADFYNGRQFSQSGIGRRLDIICENGHFHLLGTTSYPPRSYLLTPFTPGQRSDKQTITYNNALDNALEQTIGAAFHALKRRFPALAKLRFCSQEKVDRFVLACCVLHNVCIDASDQLPTGKELEEEEFFNIRCWQRPYRECPLDDMSIQQTNAGILKRDQICSNLLE